MTEHANSLADALSPLHDFWRHWGFEPWSRPPFAGVSRGQRFVKDGILGRVAEYRAWDGIVWACGNAQEREALWRRCKPLDDVFTQRFLFIVDDPWAERRIRSFAWGFLGYLEFYAYWPGKEAHEKVRDLTGLIDIALRLTQTGNQKSHLDS